MNTELAHRIQSYTPDSNLLARINESCPYYTSYPTLGLWSESHTHLSYIRALESFTNKNSATPLHLYIHIPFCAQLCWYCICNIKVTKNNDKMDRFVQNLIKEIRLLESFFQKCNRFPLITEIHLGGGTPSHLPNKLIKQLVAALSTVVDFSSLHEFTMEIDPRTASRENLQFYAELGVTRISFGVQDFDHNVQKAINRIQPPEMIDALLDKQTRDYFKGVNFDLLYGLPVQTRHTFKSTIDLVNQFRPERITLLKYAHVPDVRKHMKLIDKSELPNSADLPEMFVDSVQSFQNVGYKWIGIDHFALPTDDLAVAQSTGKIHRSFNGFTPGRTANMLGLGPTSTSNLANFYFQSTYDLTAYAQLIQSGKFPIHRGHELNQDEQLRREIIFQLLCCQTVCISDINKKYEINFFDYFKDELDELTNDFSSQNWIHISSDSIHVTAKGRYVIRSICRVFDRFFSHKDYKVLGP